MAPENMRPIREWWSRRELLKHGAAAVSMMFMNEYYVADGK
jgi:hypothetical protein